MELLLNLAWLLLALPAYWLWQRAAASRQRHGINSLQCILTLGCVLVILFPVISASDDLHAMRAEMEESASATNKRAVRQAGTDKSSAWLNRGQGPPAMIASEVRLVTPEVRPLEICVVHVSSLGRPSIFYAGRAPPSLLG